MKTTESKAVVNVNNSSGMPKKNETVLKRKSRWDRITGGISRKDLNSMKYYSICNSDVSSLSNVRRTLSRDAPTADEQIVNIDAEKPKYDESELKNSSYGLALSPSVEARSTSNCFNSIKNYFNLRFRSE